MDGKGTSPYPEPPPPYYAGAGAPEGTAQQMPQYPQQAPQYPYDPSKPPTTYAQGPPPSQQMPGMIIVGAPQSATTTTIVVSSPCFGPNPVNMQCPHCHAQIVSQVDYTAGTLAWIICVVLILFGCWIGCCLIPFCIQDFQDVEHRCPNCKQFLGSYRRV